MIKDFLKGKKICIIGAHPDDIELGMGGTLNQIKDLDVNVRVASLSTTIKGNEGILRELRDSMSNYNILFGEKAFQWEQITRMFHANKTKIRDIIFKATSEFDVFFTHSKLSQHDDHRVIAEAVDDIMKEKTIITWEEVHSGKNIPVNMWNEIRASDLMTKTHALDCYKSQKHRPYFEGDHITTLARHRGNQILKPYAEAFNVVRLVL
jgi:LmbE family N-acetylglucosaminyl deacetylase